VLLALADQQFDVIITADHHVYDQQKLEDLHVAVLVIPTNNSRIVQQLLPALLQSLKPELPPVKGRKSPS